MPLLILLNSTLARWAPLLVRSGTAAVGHVLVQGQQGGVGWHITVRGLGG